MEKEAGWIALPYPISANRYWRRSGHAMYVSKEAIAYKKQVQYRTMVCGTRPIDGPVTVYIFFHPKQKKDGTAYAQRLDIDNVIKVTLDALIGVAYHDDKQVLRLVAEVGEAIPEGGLSVLFKPYERIEKNGTQS